MRLACVTHGHALPAKAMLGVMGLVSGEAAPDIVKTLYYRPGWFGLPFSELTQEIMRGDSEWTIGERELFASFTSSLNRCEF